MSSAAKIEWLPTAQILPNQDNPRNINDDKFRKLVQSIKDMPEMLTARPLVVNQENVVLGGNMRLKALQEVGAEEVPVMRVDWPEHKQRAFIIKDNLGYGEWDWDVLANEWDAVQLEAWGLDVWTPESEMGAAVMPGDTDVVPELQEDVVSQVGDVWQLGDHRLMCGDSTSAHDMALLMDGQLAQLIHADPPYGMGKEKDGVLNDNLYREKLDKFQMDWWRTARKHTLDNASAYIWGNAPDLWRLWYQGGLANSEKILVRNEIVWDKKNIAGMRSELMHQYPEASERCLYLQIGQQFIGNLNKDDFPEAHRPMLEWQQNELAKSGLNREQLEELTGVKMYGHWFSESQFQIISEKHYQKLQQATPGFQRPWSELKAEWEHAKQEVRGMLEGVYAEIRSYFDNTHDTMRDVWEYSRVHGDERHGHATPKPVPMMERIMKSSAQVGGLVLEPFIGSGSTLIAAETTGRRCYGMELDPRYVDVVVRRWESVTHQKAILTNRTLPDANT